MRLGLHGTAVAPLVMAFVLLPITSFEQTNGASVLKESSSNLKMSAPLENEATPPVDDRVPLPEIPTLMQDVERHQRAAEAMQKNYLYHSVEMAQEVDGRGAVKKTTTKEFDDFWLSGVPVRRLVKKDGKDLSAEEQQKESERIDKEAAKAHSKKEKGDAAGKDTDPRGNEEITVSRFLELGHFTNPRRVRLNGRDTIAVDYAGDPKAKTRNRSEEVIRDLVGTVWADEQDRVLSRIEGHFLNAFKIGAGLLINIRKNTSFALELNKVNNEVWLPARVSGQGAARALLFFNFDGKVQVTYSDYRKFKATSTILPGVSPVREPGATATPAAALP